MSDHHDVILKDLLGNRDFAVSFLQRYMPQELVSLVDWETVDLDKASVEHIRQQDKDNIKSKEVSDLCFTFKFKDGKNGAVFTHIELQSTDDETLIIRVKHYQTSYILDWIKRNRGLTNKLPLVVSIIYYANKKPFSHSLDITDYFENQKLAKKYAFDINLVDLTKFSDEELKNHGFIAGLELIIKHIAERNIDGYLLESSREITRYDYHIRRTLIRYMGRYSDLEKQEFYNTLIASEPELEGDVMTVAQQWLEQGKNQGIQEGLEKGILQGRMAGIQEGELNAKKETALNFLNCGVDINVIARCTGLSINEIEALSNNIS